MKFSKSTCQIKSRNSCTISKTSKTAFKKIKPIIANYSKNVPNWWVIYSKLKKRCAVFRIKCRSNIRKD